ncbi:ABC transporter ATP-binding protein [Actinophytocola algeriensis]|uniref:Putative ABC transport system ATP-binding protein n=1 Tax=Actinophytocola algeriensis TaxID=1768010 RepID=A0A7W7VJN7_9PSEU|nr:ABC transporter ATP-binding protein [Actinophytocola algeriensis]MBB4912285.1 putative ABC transport system ATP-binding protein [Actinophytocola algeriensis]MBE1474199.1 putative ABC transport system ATP-binding protein [Actinophytocola algeriensis]
MNATPVLRIRGLTCQYPGDAGPVHALRGVDLDVGRGSFVAIMGPSGSGKTTLLHCAAGLQQPTSGLVELEGRDLTRAGQVELARLRRRQVGFVFQSFNLLSALTAGENVELPLRLDGRRADPRRTAALLQGVGLGERAGHRPDQLSGGQKQRVAVARALITDPDVVFADEPTGALDIRSAREVLALLRGLADRGQTIIMVTHDPVAASFSDQVLFLADGRIVDRLARPSASAVATRMATLVESAERAANEAVVG